MPAVEAYVGRFGVEACLSRLHTTTRRQYAAGGRSKLDLASRVVDIGSNPFRFEEKMRGDIAGCGELRRKWDEFCCGASYDVVAAAGHDGI